MVNKDFFQALDLLEQEKKISREKMIEALEAGILFAFKKEYGEARQITVRCDETRNTIKVFAYRNVVETVEDPEKKFLWKTRRRSNRLINSATSSSKTSRPRTFPALRRKPQNKSSCNASTTQVATSS